MPRFESRDEYEHWKASQQTVRSVEAPGILVRRLSAMFDRIRSAGMARRRTVWISVLLLIFLLASIGYWLWKGHVLKGEVFVNSSEGVEREAGRDVLLIGGDGLAPELRKLEETYRQERSNLYDERYRRGMEAVLSKRALATVTTNADGHFEFQRVHRGDYYVYAAGRYSWRCWLVRVRMGLGDEQLIFSERNTWPEQWNCPFVRQR